MVRTWGEAGTVRCWSNFWRANAWSSPGNSGKCTSNHLVLNLASRRGALLSLQFHRNVINMDIKKVKGNRIWFELIVYFKVKILSDSFMTSIKINHNKNSSPPKWHFFWNYAQIQRKQMKMKPISISLCLWLHICLSQKKIILNINVMGLHVWFHF